MKVLHVSPSFYPATYYGGPIYSTYALCNALAENPDIQLRVLSTDTAGPHRDQKLRVESVPTRLASGYDVYYCKRWFGADIAPGMFWRLWSLIRWADVVHLNAVYSPPTIPTLAVSRVLNKPVVWSTRGALQRWEGSTRPRVKSIWNRLCNSLCDERRVMLHFTSEGEREESRASIPDVQTAIIPNAVELPETDDHSPPRGNDLRLLYLGRLHPIKGIENLLQALVLVDSHVSLSICGDGDKEYRRTLERWVSDLGLNSRVEFRGHVSGASKSRALSDADVCIVPSFKENFCLVAAEALAHSVPVIASKGTPWAGLEDKRCGYWVENSPGGLAEAVTRMRQAPREEMGRRGREWIKREFSSAAIASAVTECYRSLLSGKPLTAAARLQEAHIP